MKMRLDKWLWAARFFKTRSLAQKAIASGQVQVNTQRPKSSREIAVGDVLCVQQPHVQRTVVVLQLTEQRGSTSVAATLFAETPESRLAHEQAVAQQAMARLGQPDYGRRPDKQARRALLGLHALE